MRRNKQEQQERFALTLLFTGVVFCYILLTVLIVGLALFTFLKLGWIDGTEEGSALSIILIFAVASLPVGSFMSFLLSRVLLKPVNTIINRMNSLARGEYHVRLRLGSFGKRFGAIRELTESFNRMAEELESTELLRSDFVNNFSHEFKTPIVSIAGFAKLLKRGDPTPEQREEYLAIIEEESLRLSQMATNVLNLTRVENQTVLTGLSKFNLSEQIRGALLLLGPKWEKRTLEFLLDFEEYAIEANEELLKQVWINLLDNAIKFSDEGGTIEVSIEESQENIMVCIGNSGPTIPEEKTGKIFNKFYQVDESHAAEGNGVGLAIVKRVVELHGGSIEVLSECGVTTFAVTLPR